MKNKKSLILPAIIHALMASSMFSWTAQAETGRWYDIEVIFFTNRRNSHQDFERWDNQLQMQLDPDAFELFDPDTAAPLTPERNLEINQRLEDKITNPVSGLLAEDELIYQKQAEKIDKYYATQVILHTGWRQLFTDDTPVKLHIFGGTDFSENFNLSGFVKPPSEEGDDLATFVGPVIPTETDEEGEPLDGEVEGENIEATTESGVIVNTLEEAPERIAEQATGLPLDGPSPQDGYENSADADGLATALLEPKALSFEELLALGEDKPHSIQVHPWDVESIYRETLTPTQLHLWQLDGFITINLEHYMQIATDFVIRKSVKEPQKRVRPSLAEEASDAIARLLEDSFGNEENEQAETTTEGSRLITETISIDRLKQFKLSQKRALKSHDIHFIDHPLLGIMIAIRPYKPVEDLEQRLGIGQR